MRRHVLAVTVAAALAGPGAAGHAQQPAAPQQKTAAAEDGLALTPPMGWWPWNQFGQNPQTEELIKQTADAMVASGMRDAGYSYMGPDEGVCFYRDPNGELASNLKRYPGGLRALGDYIHRKGLKYALYTDAGSRTCSGAMPGTKDHERQDMRAFAAWRCDFLKIDWCNTGGQDPVKTYTLLHEAQRAAGRPLVHSLCSWGKGEPWKWAAAIGHMWRTTGDICAPGRASWRKALGIAMANERLHPYAGPGHWNDPDMMIAGMAGPSDAQNRSFFGVWCMMAAPLMAGNDVRKMSKPTVEVLTNIEAIGVNQDPLGIQGRIVRRDGQVSIWGGKPLFDGSRAVLVLNQAAAPAEVQVKWSDAGLDDKAALFARDLWAHKTTGPLAGGLSVTVAPDGAAMLRVSKTNAFPIPPVIWADSYLLSFRAGAGASGKLSQAAKVTNRGTGALAAWKVTSKLPDWLTVSVAVDGQVQTFTNTVSPAGLKKGLYHALVRADNTEPVSGRAMSALYYDVDLDVGGAAEGAPR